jgi:hypothetical protein
MGDGETGEQARPVDPASDAQSRKMLGLYFRRRRIGLGGSGLSSGTTGIVGVPNS